jgi:hypothetical protein
LAFASIASGSSPTLSSVASTAGALGVEDMAPSVVPLGALAGAEVEAELQPNVALTAPSQKQKEERRMGRRG